MTTTGTTASRTATPTFPEVSPPIWARALIAAAVVAVVNVVIVSVGRAAGASLTMEVPDPVTIEWPAVVTFSVVPLVLAGVVTWLVARRRPRARVWLAWAGLVVAVLSCGVLAIAPDVATAMTLGSMHLAVGLAWFLALTVRARA